nr:reverse transcriptase domain-containing protein [Tanacetum cinerariifolium]
MEELCQLPLNGRGRPIAPIAILATNFRLKNDMIQQVQNSYQFYGLLGEDANKHLDKFLHVTQSIKVNGVTNDAIRLYLFPHSLTHHATTWFDRLPRNSINTFYQMAKIFLGKYFPPSMVMNLRNEITNICQRLDESLFKAWERYKLSIDRCPNHNMLPVTQIDTFYNGLILRHRDTINATSGGTFMKRRLEECYDLIKSMNAHHNDWYTFVQRSESSSSITSSFDLEIVVVKAKMINTALSLGSGTLPSNTITKPKEDLKGITTRSGNAYQGPTIATTSYSPPKVVECVTEETNDTMPPTNNRSTKDVQPPVVQVENKIPNFELVVAPIVEPVEAPANDQKEKVFQIFQDLNFNISFTDALILMTKFGLTIKSLLTKKDKLFKLARTPLNLHCSAVLLKKLPEKLGDLGKFLIPFDFLGMDECLALADLGTGRVLIDVYEGELTLRVGKEAVTFNLDQTSRYSANYDDINPTPSTKTIVSNSSPTLTPFRESDFLLKETDAFLAIDDEPISLEIDDSYYDSEGDILLFEEFLNDDPSSPPLPPQELKVVEPTNDKYSINKPLMVELKDLPPNLEYVFLEGDDKLPVIIAKDLKDEEKTALIKVLKSHKQALDWQLSDIKGIDPKFYTHKILIEDDFKPAVQHQRRTCLSHLDKMLKWCEDTNLCLNWEKSHFMVKQGIVLGHKVSKNRIEDFSKIARPMTRLLEKDTLFFFSKEKTKRIHDSKIKDRVFNVGDRVLLINSRLKILSGKLKIRWSGPFTITQVFPYGTVELSQTDAPNFKVNVHRLKHYFGEDMPKMVVSNLQTFPKDQ